MKKPVCFVSKTPFGLFATDSSYEIIHYQLFDEAGQFEQPISEEFLSHLADYEIEFRRLQNSRAIALSLSQKSNEEANNYLHKFCLSLSSAALKGSIGKDRFVMQAYNAYNDLSRMEALLYERLGEWFSLHYPECQLHQRKLAEAVASLGRREKFNKFTFSNGVEISEPDEEALKSFAASILVLAEEKKKMEKYVRSAVMEIMPNFSSLIDPLLAARFLATAGSLEKLSRMTSSTIQLLGAEKALFRHLKSKKKDKSPKFGILFTSSIIQNTPREKQGKAARLVSSKLMIGAKIDFYSRRLEPRLKKELDEELKNI